jgi:alkylation response protein AidB-like acyl-CoA dehydrogenase
VPSAWREEEWVSRAVLRPPTGPDVPAALELAAELAPLATSLGSRPWAYFSALATVAAADLTSARAAEPHLDATAIQEQAGHPDLSMVGVDAWSTFGVFAANGPGGGLRVTESPDGSCRLHGTKPWCSLADTVTHALVTAGPPERPELHAVPLRHPGVVLDPAPWVSRGLADIRTSAVHLTDVPSVRVAADGWYLIRPGFAWGGIGVAAVWFGAAAALGASLRHAADRREPDQLALAHLGLVDRVLHAALLSLRDAASAIRDGCAVGVEGAVLAARVRAVVADAAEQVVIAVGHALGPAPLTQDEGHARRVADLTVYLRQHHAERDLARLGALTLSDPAPGPTSGR